VADVTHAGELRRVFVAVMDVGPVRVSVGQAFVAMQMTVALAGAGVVVGVEVVTVVVAMAVDVFERRVRMEMGMTTPEQGCDRGNQEERGERMR
jgi:hypothetical protein